MDYFAAEFVKVAAMSLHLIAAAIGAGVGVVGVVVVAGIVVAVIVVAKKKK